MAGTKPKLKKSAMSLHPIDWIVFAVVGILLALMLSGCGTIPRIPKITLPHIGSVTAPQDPGTPAKVDKTEITTTVPVPAGSEVAVSMDGETRVTLKEPTTLTQTVESTSATTGTIDQTVAQHRIDADQETILAKHRLAIGAALLIGGIVVAFVLPGPMRWPMAGALSGGVGLLLILMPNPPAWMVMLLVGGAAAFVLSHFLHKNKTPDA